MITGGATLRIHCRGGLPPLDSERGQEIRCADADGSGALRAQDEAEEELVPRVDEAEDPDGRHDGAGKRHNDVTENLPVRCPVHTGSFLNGGREILHEPDEQHKGERHVDGAGHQREPDSRVQEPDQAEHEVQRNDEDDQRNGAQVGDQGKERAAAVAEPHDPIGCGKRDGDGKEGAGQRNAKAVEQEKRKVERYSAREHRVKVFQCRKEDPHRRAV